MGIREVFGFGEKTQVRVGPIPQGRLKTPPAGACIVEVQDADGETLAIDTVRVLSCAPKGAFYVDNVPSTFVIDGLDRAYQKIVLPAGAAMPVPIPSHLLDKPGAAWVHLWWSCHA